MTDKQIKEEIKQVVTNLGNIKFTVEDELEFCKQVLKRKEQECEELKENLSDLKKDLKFQNNKISELELELQNANSTIENLDLMRVGEYNALVDDYKELEKRHNDSFEQFKELKSENEHLSEKEEEARHYLKEAEKFKNCLTEIKEIVIDTGEQRPPFDWGKTSDNLKQILQKINECEEQ